MSDYIFIYITCESSAQAESIGNILLEQGLAACVNIQPAVTSMYKWEGEVTHSEEVPMLVKTRASLFNKIEQIVRDLHSYDNPCVVSLALNQGSEPFFKWIEENTIKP